MLNTPIGHCVDWTQKYAISPHYFPFWNVFVVYLLGWVWDPQLCWCWLAYAHCVTACMTTCSLSVERLNTDGHVNFFLLKHFIPSIFNCLCNVKNHLAQTCCSKPLLTRKHFFKTPSSMVKPIIYKHGKMMSPWRHRKQRISNFPLVQYLFPPKHFIKIFVKIWKFSTK